MSDTAGSPYALWLVPSDDLLDQLRGTVADLATRFNAPLFAPHSTLCTVELSLGLQALQAAMEALCQGLSPISLSVQGLGQTDEYFTFFYIKLADDDPQQIFRRAALAIRGARLPRIGPHVSLIYSDRIGEIDRVQLVQQLSPILPQRIMFDSVQLVTPVTGTWLDVASWQVICSSRLTAK